ncbi:unnamed protein product [Prunus armeniaca]
MAPAQEKQPGLVLGPTSPGRPKGNFRLGFSPSLVTSAYGKTNFFLPLARVIHAPTVKKN